MANTLKLKRSSSSGVVPTTAQLDLGELALNTYDGRLFTKRNNGTDSIVEFVSNAGTWGISITGNAATVGGKAIGSSGNTIPLLDQANTWSGEQTLSNGAVIGSSASVSFGSNVRQMINLYSTTYGIGVQSNTQYFRSNNHFAWFKDGVHSATALDPGAGGTLLLTLENTGDLTAKGLVQGTHLVSTRLTAVGPPLVVSSTAVCTNLNADMLDGKHVGSSGNAVPLLDQANTWSALQLFGAGFRTGDQSINRNDILRDVAQYSAGSFGTVTGALVVMLGRGIGLGTFISGRFTIINAYGAPIHVEFGGYYTNANTWSSTFARCNSTTVLAVRFAKDANNYPCIILSSNADPVASTWSNYIRARLDHVDLGWVGAEDANNLNPSYYTTSLATDISGYTVVGTQTPTLLPAGMNVANTWSGTQTFSAQMVSTVATGTAPFSVASTTRVANLNVATAGNADTATKLATTRALTIGSTAKNFDGSAAVSWTLAEIGAAAVAQTMYIGTTAVAINRASASLALTGITSIDGSAATLTTARTINGTSFNGSANITTASWGTSRSISIGASVKAVDGSGNVSWTLEEIGALSSAGGSLSGQLTISGSPGIPALDTAGDIIAGNVYATTIGLLSTPTDPTHAVDKEYVDAKATKDNCTAATFNPIPYGVFNAGVITITYTPFTFTSVASDSITLTGHQFNTGDAIRLAPSVNDASNYLAVGGTAQATNNTSNRYVIKVDANTIKIATSVANALAGTANTVAITGSVTVTVNIAPVIDGQTITTSSRLLVKSQSAAAENGIYSPSSMSLNAWVLERTQDADAWSDLVAALVPISQGTVNTDSLWLCIVESAGTLNTSGVTFKALGSKDVTYGQPNSTSPTISTVGAIAASKFIREQAAPSTQNTAATLTAAQIAAGILTTAPTGAITLTLPTGTTMETNVIPTGDAYDFYVINTSAYAVTIAGNTGHTIVGNATISANTSAHWCIRKTAANTFISYRVA